MSEYIDIWNEHVENLRRLKLYLSIEESEKLRGLLVELRVLVKKADKRHEKGDILK